MKSDFDGLTKIDQVIIVEGMETEFWRVIKKVVGLRRDAIGGQLLTMYNREQVPYTQGKAEGQKELIEFFSTVNKMYRKAEEEKKQDNAAK